MSRKPVRAKAAKRARSAPKRTARKSAAPRLAAKTVRLLIVGTGRMANSHVSSFRPIPGVEIVGGVDVDGEGLVPTLDRHHRVVDRNGDVAEDRVAFGR